jgi:hypothetical protein
MGYCLRKFKAARLLMKAREAGGRVKPGVERSGTPGIEA